jgi:hypothetical protein
MLPVEAVFPGPSEKLVFVELTEQDTFDKSNAICPAVSGAVTTSTVTVAETFFVLIGCTLVTATAPLIPFCDMD